MSISERKTRTLPSPEAKALMSVTRYTLKLSGMPFTSLKSFVRRARRLAYSELSLATSLCLSIHSTDSWQRLEMSASLSVTALATLLTA